MLAITTALTNGLPFWKQTALVALFTFLASLIVLLVITVRKAKVAGLANQVDELALRVIEGRQPTKLRIISKTPHFQATDQRKLKVWIEVRNESASCKEVRASRWETLPLSQVSVMVPKNALQIRLGGDWLPVKGTERVHVAPNDSFQMWISPDESYPIDQISTWCNLNQLGNLFVFADGVEEKLTL